MKHVGWVLLILLAACSAPPMAPPVGVPLYVRNLDDADVVLTLDPQTEPETILGFGARGDPTTPSMGAGCYAIPVGARVWLMDLLGLREGGEPVQRIFSGVARRRRRGTVGRGRR